MFETDQADGLRRLFSRPGTTQPGQATTAATPPIPVRVLVVAGAEEGKVSAVAALVRTELAAGRHVLVMDGGDGELARLLVGPLGGRAGQPELEHLLRRQHGLHQVMQQGLSGVRVLPAATALARVHNWTAAEFAMLHEALGQLAGWLDVVIVCCREGSAAQVLPILPERCEVWVTVADSVMSATAAYQEVKLLASAGKSRCHILPAVSSATLPKKYDASRHQALCRNLAETAHRFLAVAMGGVEGEAGHGQPAVAATGWAGASQAGVSRHGRPAAESAEVANPGRGQPVSGKVLHAA